MGIVYLARRDGANEPVALKILLPAGRRRNPVPSPGSSGKMWIGRIVPLHPNVVATVDSGEIDGVYFLAMEYVPGPTLKRQVAKGGALAPGQAAHLFAQAAAGLAAVHAIGVVHRDVSPGNLILTPAGDLKLLDFGVAIVVGEPLPADPTVAGGVGYTMGTIDYIAPEQVRNASAVTFASDLYALGCSLYFALAGTPPYPGGDLRQKIRWHKRAEVPAGSGDQPERLLRTVAARRAADGARPRPTGRNLAAAVARELQSFAPPSESLSLAVPSNPEPDFFREGENTTTGRHSAIESGRVAIDWVFSVRCWCY